MRAAGFGALAVAVLLAAGAVQSGAVRWERGRAESWDRRVTMSAADALAFERGPAPAAQREAARRAGAHYARADAVRAGGLGLLATPEVVARRAWMAVVQERYDEAAAHLRRLDRPEAPARSRLELARVLALAGRREEALAVLRRTVAEHPVDPAPHRELAAHLERAGRPSEAAAELVIVANLAPGDGASRARLVELLEALGRQDEADAYR
jgi:thioredoxin-like negative regulator of GroEL